MFPQISQTIPFSFKNLGQKSQQAMTSLLGLSLEK
jgi:hypothetical protein